MGSQLVAEAITYPGQTSLKAQPITNYYSLDAVISGTFKTAGNLTFLRVFGVGHEVIVALQVFEQTMRGERLSST